MNAHAPIPADALAFRRRAWIGILGIGLAAVVELLSPPWVAEGSLLDVVLDLVGWGLFVGYATMRIWSILHVGGRKGRALVTDGPYAVVRNPLYVGSLLFGLSCAAFLHSPLVLAAVGVGAAVYVLRVLPAEERALEARWGAAYTAYAARTPRLIPRFRLRASPKEVVLVLRGIRAEARKLWLASAMPPLVLLLNHLRHLDGWPHPFPHP